MTDEPEICVLCGQGQVIPGKQEIGFHQWTDKGYVHCRAVIPMGICNACGAKTWDDAAEAIIDAAVRREYEKLK